MTLFEKLKELSFRFFDKNNYFDFYFLEGIKNWPNGNDGNPQGKENISCIRLEEDSIIIQCGADWQKPVEIEIRCEESGELYCNRSETIEEFQPNLVSLYEILDTIFEGKANNIFGENLMNELQDIKEFEENMIEENADSDSPSDSNVKNNKKRNVKPIEAPQNVASFRENLNRTDFLPDATIMRLIDQNDTPFSSNYFFRYNPQLLSSDEFNRCVDILIRRNDGEEGSPMETMQLMGELMRDEFPFREELAEIAINLIREMYNVPPEIDLKAMLEQKQAEEECDCAGPEEEEEISDERKEELRDEIEKRRILNSIVHGCAVHQWTSAYHLVRDELNDLNPVLLDKYNKLSALVNYWNWKIYFEPMFAMGQMPVLQGINKVDIEKKEVEASAMNFPVLIHELSKGVMDFLISIGIPKEVNGREVTEAELKYIYAEADNYAHEQWHYFFGPTLWRAMLHTAGVQSQDLPPIISKMAQMDYVELANFCINIVFDTEEKGKEGMDKIIESINK